MEWTLLFGVEGLEVGHLFPMQGSVSTGYRVSVVANIQGLGYISLCKGRVVVTPTPKSRSI